MCALKHHADIGRKTYHFGTRSQNASGENVDANSNINIKWVLFRISHQEPCRPYVVKLLYKTVSGVTYISSQVQI